MRHLFIGLICILLGVGIQMVHSASLTTTPGTHERVYLERHLLFLLISVTCGYIAALLPVDLLRRNALRLLLFFVSLLILVLVPGVGTRVNGAQRWIRIGRLSLQPSELGRLVMPLTAAWLLTSHQVQTATWPRRIAFTLLPLIVTLPLIAAEPDLGNTVFIALSYTIALFIGGWPLRYFLAGLLLLLPAGFGVFALKSYQMQRIVGFMEAWRDLSRAPWQIRQSLLSLGSGGLQGTGIGAGWQKLSYLPEANTDFVFAVIGEELGLLGTMTLIIIWISVYLTGRSVVNAAPRRSFEWIFGTTLVIQIVLQALANVAVVTAMVPPKGVPHPFISYGGTNLLVNIVAVGLIAGISRQSPNVKDATASTANACTDGAPAVIDSEPESNTTA